MSKRILVVEDQEDNRQILRDLLASAELEVVEAWDGEAALTVAASERPDLILMDIQLPGIDGMEALARLRRDERTASIPVLALTAQAMSGDRERFLEVGFDGYLSKPIDVAELIQAVRELCDRG